MRNLSRSHTNWLLALMIFALAARMIVPTGWMPSVVAGQTVITLCTGAGMVEAWVDADGNIHKQSPAKKGTADQPCAFAGLSAAADIAALDFVLLPLSFAPQLLRNNGATAVAIGLGLAAPPPPATAPPALI